MLGIIINQEPSHDTANYRVKSPLSVNYQNLRLRNLASEILQCNRKLLNISYDRK